MGKQKSFGRNHNYFVINQSLLTLYFLALIISRPVKAKPSAKVGRKATDLKVMIWDIKWGGKYAAPD